MVVIEAITRVIKPHFTLNCKQKEKVEEKSSQKQINFLQLEKPLSPHVNA